MAKRILRGLCLALFPALASEALPCTTTKMKTTESGLIFTVIGGSDKVEAKTNPGSKDVVFMLDLLAPYFVVCEEDQFHRITDLASDSVGHAETGKVGYVLKDQSISWPTREALRFSTAAFAADRPEIVARDDEAVLRKFLESGNQKLGPPAFREDLQRSGDREECDRLDAGCPISVGGQRHLWLRWDWR